jgi:hypothetical protein
MRRVYMGIEIIHHQPDPLRLGKIGIGQPFHLLGKVLFGAARGDVDVAPPEQRLYKQKQVRRAFAFVLIVVTFGLA